MKLAALALTLTAASLSSLAHADPAASAHQKLTLGEHAAPAMYLQLGSMFGSEHDGEYLAGMIDAGIRLGHTPVWAHGQLAVGDAVNGHGIFGSTDEGMYRSLRGGLELRGTLPSFPALGAYVGVDVGYHSLDVGRHDDMNVNVASAVVVLRGGLDIGSKHVRFRPGIERTPIASLGGDGTVINAAVAYQW